MNCSKAQPLLAGYALGVLDREGRASLDRHTAACTVCRDDLKSLQQAAERLAFAADPAEPPPAMKSRLMARIESLEAAPRAPSAFPGSLAGAVHRRIRRVRPARAVAASMAAVALFMLGWGSYETVRVNRLARQNEELATAVRRQWRAITLAADPRVETIAFRGSEAAPAAKGNLLFSREIQEAMLVVMDLDPPAKGEVYQLWLLAPEGGTRHPVAIFRDRRGGYGMWTFQPPMTMAGMPGDLSFGLTREPAGGSIAPTSPMLFTIPIASR